VFAIYDEYYLMFTYTQKTNKQKLEHTLGYVRYSVHCYHSLYLPRQVSDILLHPHFHSAPDSDLAVLKLKDKAKISQHVLPVCLPKMQGGEVTVQEVYTVRWILPNNPRHRHTTSSHTKVVELSDVAHCEREFAQGGAYTTVIGDNSLCVMSKPPSPQRPCPGVIPGIAIVQPMFSSSKGVLSGHEETQEASGACWQLLGLERFSYEKNSCRQHSYTVQTKIANFRDWIEENIK